MHSTTCERQKHGTRLPHPYRHSLLPLNLGPETVVGTRLPRSVTSSNVERVRHLKIPPTLRNITSCWRSAGRRVVTAVHVSGIPLGWGGREGGEGGREGGGGEGGRGGRVGRGEREEGSEGGREGPERSRQSERQHYVISRHRTSSGSF